MTTIMIMITIMIVATIMIVITIMTMLMVHLLARRDLSRQDEDMIGAGQVGRVHPRVVGRPQETLPGGEKDYHWDKDKGSQKTIVTISGQDLETSGSSCQVCSRTASLGQVDRGTALHQTRNWGAFVKIIKNVKINWTSRI